MILLSIDVNDDGHPGQSGRFPTNGGEATEALALPEEVPGTPDVARAVVIAVNGVSSPTSSVLVED